MVIVYGEGSEVAGTSYSLTCTVTLPSGVAQVSPNIKWKRPNMPFTPASTRTDALRDFIASLQVKSLRLTDGGEYICQASYSLGGHTSILVNKSITLIVIGKCLLALCVHCVLNRTCNSSRGSDSVSEE